MYKESSFKLLPDAFIFNRAHISACLTAELEKKPLHRDYGNEQKIIESLNQNRDRYLRF